MQSIETDRRLRSLLENKNNSTLYLSAVCKYIRIIIILLIETYNSRLDDPTVDTTLNRKFSSVFIKCEDLNSQALITHEDDDDNNTLLGMIKIERSISEDNTIKRIKYNRKQRKIRSTLRKRATMKKPPDVIVEEGEEEEEEIDNDNSNDEDYDYAKDEKVKSSSKRKKIRQKPLYLEKSYQCSTCGRLFSTNHRLVDHESTHTNVKAHKCDACDKEFRTRSDLKKHSVVHVTEKKFKCDVCGKLFARAYGLKTHAFLHTGKF